MQIANSKVRYIMIANQPVKKIYRANAIIWAGMKWVHVTAADGGSVLGDGEYDYNSNATVIAHASPGYEFTGWKNVEYNTIVSTNASYTFVVIDDIELQAQFSKLVSET